MSRKGTEKEKRLYVVREGLTEGGYRDRLVNAVSKGMALKHVVLPKHVVGVATAGDVALLMGAGVKVEEAETEPSGLDAANSWHGGLLVGNSNAPLLQAHNEHNEAEKGKVKVRK